MKIYLSHARSFDFRQLLYEPLLESDIRKNHTLILPYLDTDDPYPFEANLPTVDLIVADVSYPSTGQGIELGLAKAAGKRILCFYREGTQPPTALAAITPRLYSYKKPDSFIYQLTTMLPDTG